MNLRTSPETVNRVARRMLEGPGRRRRKDDLVYDGRYRIEVGSSGCPMRRAETATNCDSYVRPGMKGRVQWRACQPRR